MNWTNELGGEMNHSVFGARRSALGSRHSALGTRLTALLMTTFLGSAVAQAQSVDAAAGNENMSFDFQAEAGVEALEEPNAQSELDTNAYVTVNASALIRLFNFQSVLNAPLRFNLNDGFAIREADWDEGRDYLRIFRCARLDYMTRDGIESHQSERGGCASWTPNEAAGDVAQERENFLYLSTRLRPVYDYSLGYGSLVQGYNAMLEEDTFRDGVLLETNINRHFVVNAAISDVADPTVLAGRVAFRPIQAQGSDSGGTDTDNFLEVGVTVASDLQPPTYRDGALTTTDALMAGGADVRFRISSENRYEGSYRILRFELGSEVNQIFDYGMGIHNHLRFYYDVGPFDFYIDGEYRAILGQYLPSYFNQHYNVQRSQFSLSDEQRNALQGDVELERLTKLDFLAVLEDQTEHAYGATMRFRFWREVEGGWNPSVDFWLFGEDIPNRDQSGRAGAGIHVYQLADKVDINALFVQQGWDDLGGLFSLQNSVLDIDASYELTDDLFLQFFFDQTWFQIPETAQFDTANDVGIGLGYQN